MNIYTIAIILAGFFWGLNGFFCRILVDAGLSSNQVVFFRFLGAAICFAIVIFIKDKTQFKVKPKDFWCFFGSGICSLLFFTICYFQAMTVLSLSAAAILLYTAPVIITIISRFLFREKLTKTKLIALFLSFSGCVLVCGIGDLKFSFVGILLGLGSGLGYALYSVFCRLAYDRGYKSNTVNFYSCLLATIGCAVTGMTGGVSQSFTKLFESPLNVIIAVCCAFFACFLPYMLYTFGITVVPISKASILASVELLTATILGVIIYKETLNLFSIVGVVLMLTAIVILNVKMKNKKANLKS